jgi:hypothetical protein
MEFAEVAVRNCTISELNGLGTDLCSRRTLGVGPGHILWSSRPVFSFVQASFHSASRSELFGLLSSPPQASNLAVCKQFGQCQLPLTGPGPQFFASLWLPSLPCPLFVALYAYVSRDPVELWLYPFTSHVFYHPQYLKQDVLARLTVWVGH